jgi:putative membrane protein
MIRALTHWDLHPALLLMTVVGAEVLARGMQRRRLLRARNRCCWLGLGVLVIALFSPVSAYADTAFSMHMAQHMLLIYVAAPLLAVGHASSAFLLGAPATVRRRVLGLHVRVDAVASLVAAAVASNVILLGWHLPAAYDVALRNGFVHVVEHVTLFAAWYWLWAALLTRRLREPGLGIVVVFVTAVSSGALGTLLAVAPQVWYPAYHGTAHLSALSDQQLGGVVMLAVGIPVQLAVLIWSFFALLRIEERRATMAALPGALP